MDATGLLAGLDPEQRHAVTTASMPLIIRAGAGSGKTRVLTRRLAYRAATGDLDPRRALCVTFTRDAATELRSRTRRLGLRDLPAAGTFHAVALGMLRTRWHDRRQAEPALLTDRSTLLRRIAGRSLDPASLARVAGEIDWARSRAVRPERYAEARRRSRRSAGVDPALVERLFADLEDAKRKARLVDFDDLLERCAEALRSDDAFAEAQRWRFRHVFVDEFQDVNPLQFRLLQAWLGPNRDLCAVGDANQSIYGWNGADPTLFDRLADLLGGGEVVELTTNHRSSAAVVAVAGAALPAGTAPAASPARPDGPAPEVLACRDESHELATIVATLRRRHDRGVAWRQQAVLVRTNAQVRDLVEGIERAGIPARRAGGADTSLLRRLPTPEPGTDFAAYLEQLEDPALVTLAEEYAAVDLRPSAAGLLSWATTAAADSGDEPDAVLISTFHRAKGREWRAVIVAGVEDGFVPASTARLDEERRLFYVGLSRATELLTCTWAAQRTRRGVPTARQASPLLNPVLDACRLAASADDPQPMPAGLRTLRRALERRAPEGPADLTARRLERRRDALERRHDALEHWRAARARAAGIAPSAFLPDDVLASLAADPPADDETLARHPGVGPLRARRFGAELLALLAG